MKFFYIILLILCVLCTSPAFAQDIFFSERANLPTDLRDLQSEPKNLKEYADQYYADCLHLDHHILTDESRPLFCACVSANIYEVLSLQDVSDIFLRTDTGDQQRRRITKLVYVPCMAQPLNAMVYDDCMDDLNLQTLGGKQDKTCGCVADYATRFWINQGLNVATRNRSDFIKSNDPIIQFLNNTRYARHSKDSMMQCLAAQAHQPPGQSRPPKITVDLNKKVKNGTTH